MTNTHSFCNTCTADPSHKYIHFTEANISQINVQIRFGRAAARPTAHDRAGRADAVVASGCKVACRANSKVEKRYQLSHLMILRLGLTIYFGSESFTQPFVFWTSEFC